MAAIRRGVFHALVGFGTVFATPLVAQNAAVQSNAATKSPPLFQGIMVDAKGKDVGRIYISVVPTGAFVGNSGNIVIRQIDNIWVALPVADFTSGFTSVP